MKQKCLKYILTVVMLLMFFMPNITFATTKEYTIESYNIDMVVNENNTFDITETITAYFNVPKHGIYRKLPLKNSITRTDGTTSKNTAKISNVSISENYTTSRSNGYYVMKIGSSSTTITGSHTYTIKYTYDIGKDPLKDADELYYNLIGDEWDTSISNISFKITMPKEFDPSTLGFSSGKKGTTDSSNVVYTVDENVITGNVLQTLKSRQALTVRLTLPEGYFIEPNRHIDIFAIFVIIMCLIFVLIAYRLWAKYGKDEQVIETVEFYPPEGCNSAEACFLYEGTVDTQGVISLLIYLANKGYLKIEETEKKGLISKSKGLRIIKLKEYDGNNECERMFFEGLFKSKKSKHNSQDEKESVTTSDLYNNFYITLDKIKAKMNSKENKNKIFESSARSKGKYVILMIIAVFVLITVKPIMEYYEMEGLAMLPFALLFPGIGFSFMFAMLFEKKQTMYVNGKRTSSSIISKLLGLVFGGLFAVAPCAYFVLPTLIDNMMYLVTYIIGIICIAFLVLFLKIMPKRTPYGNEILGKLSGFKRFLETAEKPQLEALVNENPEYFYNILPYTYALGVSDIWMKQFETIALQAPDWYSGYSTFSMIEFNHFMNDTMKSAQSAMSSSPSSDSGGSSSGGGFSGGGSGGGGGGSW